MITDALLKMDMIADLARQLLVASACADVNLTAAEAYKLAEEFYTLGQANGHIEIKPAGKE